MSSLKESEEQTSVPDVPLSRGVQVASSHFSKISASSGNKGCLRKVKKRKKNKRKEKTVGEEKINDLKHLQLPAAKFKSSQSPT